MSEVAAGASKRDVLPGQQRLSHTRSGLPSQPHLPVIGQPDFREIKVIESLPFMPLQASDSALRGYSIIEIYNTFLSLLLSVDIR